MSDTCAVCVLRVALPAQVLDQNTRRMGGEARLIRARSTHMMHRYYLRFADPKNQERAWGEEADRDWLPVDLYVGGQEHAVLHLLYARCVRHGMHGTNRIAPACGHWEWVRLAIRS